MAEHLPESLIGEAILARCNVCQRDTKHRVDRLAIDSHAGKIGPCLEHGPKTNASGHTKAQAEKHRRRQEEARQPNLFGGAR